MTDAEEPKRIPANENPWYCLATLYGEQGTKFDDDLAKKNRAAWNRWMATALTDEQRAELIKKGFEAPELVPLSEDERTEFVKAYAERKDAAPPDIKEEEISFSWVVFEQPISFGGFVFPSEATFYGAEFSGGVDFRNSAFLSEVVFLSAEFSGDADLSETVFSAYAHFGEATFISRAKFRKATFLSDASFLRTRFSREAFFDEAKFFGPALFIETTFSKNADFERTAFSNSASFNEATFSGKVDFKEAAFSNDAYFYKTAFSGDAHFDKAAFSSGGYFKEAAFSEDAHFYKTRFSGDANFDKAVFSGKVDFKEAVFSREADFQACEFRSSTSFAFTEFLSQVPDFRDAKLREATKWYLVQWPHAPTGWLEAQKHVSAYERLKAEMERLKKHEDEQFFFAKELRARRALLWFNARSGSGGFGARATAAFEWLLNATYAAFSGYGQSVGKPICWLIAAFGLGAYALATSSFISPCPVDPGQAALLSAINLLPFLPYKAEKIVDKDIIDCLEPSAGVIGDLQSLLGVLLLFLLGLALRNRFRMK